LPRHAANIAMGSPRVARTRLANRPVLQPAEKPLAPVVALRAV
jgi:hypothetical protein